MTGTVAWFPKAEDLASNPYWELLQRGLEELGINLVTSHQSYWMQRRWLLQERSRVQVLHFHFLQPQYAGPGKRASVRRLTKFLSNLLLARALGYRLVWTMHDRMPAWPLEPAWAERFARYGMAWLAHGIIVHCEKGRQVLASEFQRRRNVHVLPHPGFSLPFADAPGRPAARRELTIPADPFLIAFIGGIRPNKGIEELLSAFSRLHEERLLLVVAGKPWPPASYVEKIGELASQDSRVLYMPRHVPDRELSCLVRAANVVVFPFKQILTSSSVVYAMSGGRAVIVPHRGCLPEVVGQEAGILYDPDEPEGLLQALKIALAGDLDRMGRQASRRVQVVTWDDLARGTARAYRLLGELL